MRMPLDFAARRPSEPRSDERSQSRTGRLARWLQGHRPPHTLQLVSSGSGISSKNRCAPHPPTHLLFRLMGHSLRGDRTAQLQPSAGRDVRRATPSSRRLSISPFQRLSESAQAFWPYGAQLSSVAFGRRLCAHRLVLAAEGCWVHFLSWHE